MDETEDSLDLMDTEGPENEWTDEAHTDSEIDSEISEMMHEMEGEFFSDSGDDSSSIVSDDTYDREVKAGLYKRYFAIVTTNKQINSEAMSIFYSEAVMTLDPGDIFCLMKAPRHMKFGWPNPVRLPNKHPGVPLGMSKKLTNALITVCLETQPPPGTRQDE
jgi:hypothetical protein